MDQHHDSQYCHKQAEDLQSERVTPHCPFVYFPPMLGAAMTSIRREHEHCLVSVGHKKIQLISTSFLQKHLQKCTKAQKFNTESN